MGARRKAFEDRSAVFRHIRDRQEHRGRHKQHDYQCHECLTVNTVEAGRHQETQERTEICRKATKTASARILRRDVTFDVLKDKDDDGLLLNVSDEKTSQK
jgi:hypothetical protein